MEQESSLAGRTCRFSAQETTEPQLLFYWSLAIASRRAGMCPTYPRHPLREFTPCAPGWCIQQDFQKSSGTGASIEFLQCNLRRRRPTQITTDHTDLTDNVCKSWPLQNHLPHRCHLRSPFVTGVLGIKQTKAPRISRIARMFQNVNEGCVTPATSKQY